METSEVLKKIDNYVEELYEDLSKGKTERFEKYLEFVKNFRQYSFNNMLLIWWQKPEAMRCAGYAKWRQVGYQVRKGEKGLDILRPEDRFYYLDPTTKERIYVGRNTKVPDGVPVQRYTVFVGAKVFDVSQCDKTEKAKDLVDSFFYDLGDDSVSKSLYQKIKEKIIKNKIEVVEEDTVVRGGVQGASFGGKIAILKDTAYKNKVLTLIHEYAHERLHWGKDKESLAKDDIEVQAEGVSFLVNKYLGVENPFSRDYILSWGKNKEAFKNNLKVIVDTSMDIIREIEGA